jgi:hypothetical protein
MSIPIRSWPALVRALLANGLSRDGAALSKLNEFIDDDPSATARRCVTALAVHIRSTAEEMRQRADSLESIRGFVTPTEFRALADRLEGKEGVT